MNTLLVQTTPNGVDPAPPGANLTVGFSLTGSAVGSGASVTLPLPLYRFGWAGQDRGYGDLLLWSPLSSSLIVGGSDIFYAVTLPAGPSPSYSIPSYAYAMAVAPPSFSFSFSGDASVSVFSPSPTCWAGGAAKFASGPNTTGVCISAKATGTAPWSIAMPIQATSWTQRPSFTYAGVSIAASVNGVTAFPIVNVPVPALSANLVRLSVSFSVSQWTGTTFPPCGSVVAGIWTCDQYCFMCLIETAASSGFSALNSLGFGTIPQGVMSMNAKPVASYAVANVLPPIGTALVGVIAAVANGVATVQCALSSSSACVPWWAPGSLSGGGVSSAVSSWASNLYNPSSWGVAAWSLTPSVIFSRSTLALPAISASFVGSFGSYPVTVQYSSALNISALLSAAVQRVCTPVSSPIILSVGITAGGASSSQAFPFAIDVGIAISALDSAAGTLGGWFGCNATCMSPAYAPVSLFVRSVLSAMLPVEGAGATSAAPWQWLPCPLPQLIATSTATQTASSGLTPSATASVTSGLTPSATASASSGLTPTASPVPSQVPAPNSGAPQAFNVAVFAVGVTLGIVVAVAIGIAAFFIWRARRAHVKVAGRLSPWVKSPLQSVNDAEDHDPQTIS